MSGLEQHREEILVKLLRSREKCYRFKDIFYDIILPKIVQLYCTSDLIKYKWVNDYNENRQIKTANVIKLKNGFDLHRIFLEAIDYGQKISKKIFPLNCSPETKKIKKGL